MKPTIKVFLICLLPLSFIPVSCSVLSPYDPTKGSVIISNSAGVDAEGKPCEKIVYQNDQGAFQISKMSDGSFFWKNSCK